MSRKTAYTNRFERLRQLEKILYTHAQGLKQSELAELLGVDRSTVWRDINYLTSVLPIWESEDGRVGIDSQLFIAGSLTEKRHSLRLNIEKLIAEGEGELLEFKVTACWDSYKKSKNHKLVENVIETVVGFMNSESGGSLLIGVSDEGKIAGLSDDYKSANAEKPNRDGYELFLRNSINSKIGGECIAFYQINFYAIQEHEICHVSCKTASKPVYFNGDFYVRNGNQTQKLTTQAAVEYIKHKWL